jgi:hypothetical protein
MMGTLYYREPGTGNWVPVVASGPAGTAAPDEVVVSDTMPVDPSIELWVDRDADLGNSGWTALDSRYVNAVGDTMSGPLAMGGQKITGLGTATASGDAMSQGAADTRYVNTAGDTMTGALAMGGFKITGLAAPTVAGDAADKTYVDGRVVVATTAPSSPTTGQLWCPI